MQAGIHGRVAKTDTRNVIRTLKSNASRLPMETVREFNDDAMATAPVDTGRLKDSHQTIRLLNTADSYSAMQRVNAFYGIYVNNGTRNMAAQPWWSQALAVARRRFAYDVKKLLR